MCVNCQLNKTKNLKIRLLPEKEAEQMIPWECVCVDLIGPYTIGNEKNTDSVATLHAMTIVDPVTGWFEIAKIPLKPQMW